MATTLAHQQVAIPMTSTLPGRRFDHLFFPLVAWLMLITVFLGFAPTYYLAGVFRAPLPSLAIHVHALVFSSWILLLIAQTSLTASGRVDVHRRLGIGGFILACSMLPVGIWAATDQLVRGSHVRDPLGFYLFPLTDIVVFAVLMLFAYRARFDSASHKRLVIVASTALMDAPIARLHFLHWSRHTRVFGFSAPVAQRLSYVFILLLIAYDLWATRRIHRSIAKAGAFLIIVQQFALQFAKTPVWHAFAGWLRAMARG